MQRLHLPHLFEAERRSTAGEVEIVPCMPVVMCAGPNGACKPVHQMRPKMAVIGSPMPLVEVAGLSGEVGRPSIFIGNCVDQDDAVEQAS